MDYYDLVQSENSDSMYERWTEYRSRLTDYIIEGIENLYISRRLADTGERRMFKNFDIEAIVAENDCRPTLAIWGAGGCNDIDIVRLVKYFRLVLIDHNGDSIRNARNRFGLREADCLCVNLNFWDISDEDYLMFEALLRDGADIEEMLDFLAELSKQTSVCDYGLLPHFDYSVVVGLVSQLNSRFAAILHMIMYERKMNNCISQERDSYKSETADCQVRKREYSNKEISDLNDAILRLNEYAVEALLEAVLAMTEFGIVTGHELCSVGEEDENSNRFQIDEINEGIELKMLEGCGDFSLCGCRSEVSGNDVFEEKVQRLIDEQNALVVIKKCVMLWPFSEGKSYLMLMNILEKTINKTW